MSIRPTCYTCKKELKEFGAIVLSPPNKKDQVKKMHLCVSCYKRMLGFFSKQ